MGFKGASVHTINESGRISVPSKIREQLRAAYSNETLVLAILGAFIAAYPVSEWEKYEANLPNPPKNREEARIIRVLYANLEEVAIDKQGRILIPPALRAKAQLTDECVIVGMHNRIEIWDKQKWDEEMASDLPDGEIGAQLNELLF